MAQIPVPTFEVDDSKTTLTITWADQHKSRRHIKWLRFHCRCERCVRNVVGEVLIDKVQFEDELHIAKIDIKDGNLCASLDKEIYGDHMIVIPLDWLKTNCNCDECMKAAMARSDFRFADPKTTPFPRVQYDALETKEGKFKCLTKFFDTGFCLIEGVPVEPEMVIKVGEMFSFVRTTGYGKHFDVKYEKTPINAGYTTTKLHYHQDLSFYEGMPGVQLLHCMEFDDSIEGGESQLVDLFKVAEVLKHESAENFKALCRIPATFQTIDLKRSKPVWYETTKPHIEVDYFGNIISMCWNVGHEGTLRVRPEDEGPYYKAYKHFVQIMTRKDMEFVFRLKVGDLLMVNNRRMAHARKAFNKAEGRRCLRGCYTNLDDTKSTFIVLAHELGKKIDPPRCGNGSWL